MEANNSIYQRAARWGVPFGLYMAVTAATGICGDLLPGMALLSLVMLVGTPVLVYRYQRRQFIDEDGMSEYAALWMLGILLFVLGAIIASLIVYLLLQYGRPGYLTTQMQAMIDTYSAMPQFKDDETLRTLQRMLDKGMMPTPIEMVFNAYWFITFTGSMTSAVTALLAQRPLKKK